MSSGSRIGSKGLAITPAAPSPTERSRSWLWTRAVMKITGISRVVAWMAGLSKVAAPAISGIITSSRIRSGLCLPASSSACAPDEARMVFQPPTCERLSSAMVRMSGSSSTRRMVLMSGTVALQAQKLKSEGTAGFVLEAAQRLGQRVALLAFVGRTIGDRQARERRRHPDQARPDRDRQPATASEARRLIVELAGQPTIVVAGRRADQRDRALDQIDDRVAALVAGP